MCGDWERWNMRTTKCTKAQLAEKWATTAEDNVILQSRINALERAIKECPSNMSITCYSCVHRDDESLCQDICDEHSKSWQFDYERFKGE